MFALTKSRILNCVSTMMPLKPLCQYISPPYSTSASTSVTYRFQEDITFFSTTCFSEIDSWFLVDGLQTLAKHKIQSSTSISQRSEIPHMSLMVFSQILSVLFVLITVSFVFPVRLSCHFRLSSIQLKFAAPHCFEADFVRTKQKPTQTDKVNALALSVFDLWKNKEKLEA